ncbi:MAG: ATP-binding cassette domain-containing protein [Bacteroidales bacterium]|nr:ATP-binding cassette domain-containing protein [Bacteroidales bacterium]
MDILVAQQINKRFEKHQALTDINIAIPEGSIYGLLGPNGAGKTTFIRIINQILGQDSGTIHLSGELLNPKHIKMIGYLPEERGLYKKMKVGEQAIYLAMLKGLSRSDAFSQLKQWFEKFEIGNWWDRKVEELSKGMQQKVQFIVTILHKPKLLIFDEPFSGFDPINANLLKSEIINLRNEGATIIFSTHNMSSVEEICDRIALINQSKVILEGKVSDIKNNHRTNLYQIEFQPKSTTFENTFPENFKIIGRKETLMGQQLTIRIDKEQNTTELLEYVMNHARLLQFQEVVPSMNDIFIKTVNNSSNRNKNGQN